jgi:hypothetical protein
VLIPRAPKALACTTHQMHLLAGWTRAYTRKCSVGIGGLEQAGEEHALGTRDGSLWLTSVS